MEPRRLGRFRIIREVGRGAIGKVFLAEDPRLQRRVAIKTLEIAGSMPAAERSQALQRFIREARAAGRLQHPGIVTVFDAGETDGTPYIAMEYIEGTGLDTHTRRPSLLPVEKVRDIAIQACEALDYAHRSGLVHRDIKPANLMLVKGKTLKITDFGLAKQPEANMTSDGTLVGTPNYMSPEQIAGRTLDGRSDLFSLGVVIHEMLAGERPFKGESVSTVLYGILHETPTPLNEFDEKIPVALARVVTRLLEKDPGRRYASGSECAAALRAATSDAAAGESIPDIGADTRREVFPPAAAPERKWKSARLFGIAAGALAAGAILALVALQSSLLEKGIPGLARTERDEQPSPAATEPPEAPPVPADGPAMQPAPAPAKIRAVRVVTDPPGARLSLDGTPIDSDILRLETAAGPRTLRAVSGCRTLETIVDPSLAPEELELTLVATGPVDVPVRTDPPGARVDLDGKDTGQTTPALLKVDPCAGASVRVEKSGYHARDVELPAEMEPDTLRDLVAEVRLEPLPDGRVVIVSPGIPLEIWAGRRRVGRTGETMTFRAGPAKLTLVNNDLFLRRTITVDVEPGETRTIRPSLPAAGKLSVQAFPSNCRVYVARAGGGTPRFLDEVPMLDRPLAPGSYTVRVEYVPTGQTQEKTVEIEPGGRVSIPFRFGS